MIDLECQIGHLRALFNEDAEDETEKGYEWLTDKMRGRMEQLKELKSLEILTDPDNEEHLEIMWDSGAPQKTTGYDHLTKDLNAFQTLLLLAAYRPDRLIPSVRTFVADTLGKLMLLFNIMNKF